MEASTQKGKSQNNGAKEKGENKRMDVNEIDWSRIWREGILFFAGEADKATSWDKIAPRWNDLQKKGDYGQKVLERIEIAPDWTVLDVGAGAGLLAIPLAKKCKHVTALDISSQMLKCLTQNAAQENVSNITCVNIPFEDTVIGKDIEKYDIVIASRSMGWERNLQKFLKNMDTAAKRRAYIIWPAGNRPFDIGLYKAIGRPYGETRMYIIIYNLLYQMGIRANIEIFQCHKTAMSYKNIDEAFTELRKRFERMGANRKLNPEEENKLRSYLQQTLKEISDGTVSFMDGKPELQAVIWWDKNIQQPPTNERN